MQACAPTGDGVALDPRTFADRPDALVADGGDGVVPNGGNALDDDDADLSPVDGVALHEGLTRVLHDDADPAAAELVADHVTGRLRLGDDDAGLIVLGLERVADDLQVPTALGHDGRIKHEVTLDRGTAALEREHGLADGVVANDRHTGTRDRDRMEVGVLDHDRGVPTHDDRVVGDDVADDRGAPDERDRKVRRDGDGQMLDDHICPVDVHGDLAGTVELHFALGDVIPGGDDDRIASSVS